MTDKVQKIREEVERMHNLLPVMDGDNISVNYADRICTTLEMYIDSLQEKPVSEDLENAAEIILKNIEPDAFHIVNQGCMNEREEPAWSEELVLKAIKDGANWQKQQMMRGATDGQIEIGEDYLRIKCLCMSCPPQYDGKLVRLIIIKDE